MTVIKKIKSFFDEVLVMPSKKEMFLIVVALSVFALFNAFLGENISGFAITDKIVNPWAYAPNDLVVNNSASGNFLFYKLLAYFPFFKNNYLARDFLISTPLALLVILGWYNIFLHLTKSRKVALYSLFFVLFADEKFSLGGTDLALFQPTSFGAVYFIQVFATLLFLKKKHTASFVLLALSSYFHPAAAFMFLFAFSGGLLYSAYKERSYKNFIKPLTITAVLMLPNIFLLRQNLGNPVDVNTFFNLFYLMHGGHAYLEDYFSRSYLYTFGLYFLMVVVCFKKKLFEHQNQVIIIAAFIFFGVMVWLVNLYFIKNLFVFYLYFPMRSTYLIKPLFLMVGVLISFDLSARGNLLDKILSILLLISMVTATSLQGFLLIVGISAYYIFDKQVDLFLKKYLKFLYINSRLLSKIYIVGIILVILFSLVLLGYKRNNKFYKIYRFFRGDNVFNFSFDVNRNYELHNTCPDCSELNDWAKQYNAKMFIIPFDPKAYHYVLRYITKNSTYISEADMGNLSYAPQFYLLGYQRMLDIGVRIKGRAVFDTTDYDKSPLSRFKKLEADFVVFDKYSPNYTRKSERPVFENKSIIVYSLK